MEALRFQVVGEAFKKKPLDVKTPSERPAKYFTDAAAILIVMSCTGTSRQAGCVRNADQCW